MRCNGILAKTQFGIVLEYYRQDRIRILPRHNLGLASNNFDQIQLNFGSDTNWNCLRIFSKRCKRNLAETQFGIVLEFFRRDGIRVWPRHNLEFS